MVQLMPLHPKTPSSLTSFKIFFNPFLNPDWFYLSGTGLPRLSWKRNCVVSYCMWCLSWLLSSLLPVLIHCMYCACRWAGNIILVSTVVCGWRTAREGFGSQWTTAGSAAVSNRAVIDRKLCRRCCHLGSYFKHTSFSCHYIRMDITCKHEWHEWHKCSTHPLRPCRPWLQEVVSSIRCLQRVLLHAKPQAEYVWASLPQPSSGVEQPVSLCANMMLSIKPEICNISLCRQMRTKPRPLVTCTKNLVKIRSVVPEIWS